MAVYSKAILTSIIILYFISFNFYNSKNNLSVDRNVASIDKYNSPLDFINRDNFVNVIFQDQSLNYNVSLLNQFEVQQYFNHLAAMPDIPYKLTDGCFARAHLMAYELKTKSIFAGKAFVIGTLRLSNPHNPDELLKWTDHVAPYVFVNVNNQIQKYILDPSLFSEAVPIEQWIKKLTEHNINHNPKLYLTPGQYYRIYSFNLIENDFAEHDLMFARESLKKYSDEQK